MHIPDLPYEIESREEIIHGQVVMMAPPKTNHNRVSHNLNGIFYNFLRGRACEYFNGEGLYLAEDEEEYIPDGMVVCDPSKVRDNGVYGAPDLVIEILSPGTAQLDKGHKKDVYEAYGVREYWIIEPNRREIDQYILQNNRFVLANSCILLRDTEKASMSAKELKRIHSAIQCSLYDDLTIDLKDIFARVP